MTASQLIDRCAASGVQLWRAGADGIGYEIPAELPSGVADRLLATLARAKPALLPLLPVEPPETLGKRNRPAEAPVRPVQAPHPLPGIDVSPMDLDLAMRDRPAPGPVRPQFALADRAPWPATAADTPERVRQWARRVLVHMAHRGEPEEVLADFAGVYGLDLAAELAKVQTTMEAG